VLEAKIKVNAKRKEQGKAAGLTAEKFAVTRQSSLKKHSINSTWLRSPTRARQVCWMTEHRCTMVLILAQMLIRKTIETKTADKTSHLKWNPIDCFQIKLSQVRYRLAPSSAPKDTRSWRSVNPRKPAPISFESH